MRKPKRPKIKLTKQKKTKILSTSCVCCVVYPHPHIFVEFSVNSILWTFFLFIFSSHSFASFNRFLCQTIFCAKARFFFEKWKSGKSWKKTKKNLIFMFDDTLIFQLKRSFFYSRPVWLKCDNEICVFLRSLTALLKTIDENNNNNCESVIFANFSVFWFRIPVIWKKKLFLFKQNMINQFLIKFF